MNKTGFMKLFQKTQDAPPEVVITPLDTRSEKDNQEKNNKEIVVKIEDENKPAEKSKEEHPQPKVRKSRLFFIPVSNDGEINLKGVIRSVQYQDAPLRSTLEILLKGPLSAEVNQGLMTLISPETRILNIYIQKDTAFLDFNEAFRFNSLGKEGLFAQLKQVVYSATEFANINKVQILIEGEKTNYLGPEGIFIGKPLSRDYFKS